MEDSVTTNEFYYLVLVIGAFGAFAVGVSVATIQYKAWLRRVAVAVPASRSLDKQASRLLRVSDLADAT
jgi:hypothetical protein